jgi:hypothetical protein
VAWHSGEQRESRFLPKQLYNDARRECVSNFLLLTLSLRSNTAIEAKAVFSYEGGKDDELSFTEGDVLSIVDRTEHDWWKADKGGIIYIVPAAYLEVVESG